MSSDYSDAYQCVNVPSVSCGDLFTPGQQLFPTTDVVVTVFGVVCSSGELPWTTAMFFLSDSSAVYSTNSFSLDVSSLFECALCALSSASLGDPRVRITVFAVSSSIVKTSELFLEGSRMHSVQWTL